MGNGGARICFCVCARTVVLACVYVCEFHVNMCILAACVHYHAAVLPQNVRWNEEQAETMSCIGLITTLNKMILNVLFHRVAFHKCFINGYI